MKHSEEFLKVPVRLYKTRDIEKLEKDEEERETWQEDVEHPRYIIGAKYIHYRYLLEPYIITDIFASPVTLEGIEAKTQTFNASILNIEIEEVMVNWSSEKLRAKIDLFIAKINEHIDMRLENENDIILSIEEYERLLQIETDFNKQTK